jgi:hypothetical protein
VGSSAHATSAVRLIGQGLLERSGPSLEQVCRIEVDPADGVTSLDLVFHYDPEVIEPLAVYRTALTDDFTLEAYLDIPGTVELQLEGGAPLSGSGDVAWVAFRVIGETGTAAGLTWGSAVLNVGGIASTTQVVRDVVIGTSDVVVSVPKNLQSQASSTVLVDISATAFGSTTDFEFTLRYNPLVAQVTNVQKTTLSDPLTLIWNGPTPPGGVLQIALFGTTFVSGSGPIVRVTFQLTGGVGSHMPLSLERARVLNVVRFADDGSLSVCPASCEDGAACSVGSCVLGQCVQELLGSSTVCRSSTGACDPAEVCSGTDTECPNDVVFPFTEPPAVYPALTLAAEPRGTLLSWSQVADASAYDVLRGDLAALAAGGLTTATDTCLASGLPAESILAAEDPAADTGFWYLIRPTNCVGPGSYDSGGPSQLAPRDDAIAASPNACG